MSKRGRRAGESMREGAVYETGVKAGQVTGGGIALITCLKTQGVNTKSETSCTANIQVEKKILRRQ